MDTRLVVSGQWSVASRLAKVRSGMLPGRSLLLESICCGLLLTLGASSPALAEGNGKSPGAGIFKSKCVLCHGADGAGNTPLGKQLQAANLHSKAVQKRSDAELHKIVHDGQANMPPFGEQLSDDEIDQVIQYVRQLGKASKTAKK